MATIAVARIGALIKLDDDTEFLLNEGDIVTDLVYRTGKVTSVISGAVRVICANTKANTAGPQTCPPDPYLSEFVKVVSLVIDSSDEFSARVTRVNVADIVGIGEVTDPSTILPEGMIEVGPGPEYKPLDQVVADADEGTVIQLLKGEYTVPLEITKSLTILGNKDVVLTKPIVIKKPAVAAVAEGTTEDTTPAEVKLDVILDNLELTGDAAIDVQYATSFTFQNSLVRDLVFTTAKGYPIKIAETPMRVVIEQNTFAANIKAAYNGIECNAILQDGSSFSNNSFEADCWVHNCINIYNAADGANIMCENNYYGAGVYGNRVGLKGDVKNVTITFKDNMRDDAIPSDWPDLCTIQPYGTATTSMKGLTLIFCNNDNKDKLLCYLYAGKSDTPWTDETYPVVIINGERVEVPSEKCPLY